MAMAGARSSANPKPKRASLSSRWELLKGSSTAEIQGVAQGNPRTSPTPHRATIVSSSA